MEGEDFEKKAGNCCGGSFFSLIDKFLPVCDYYLHGRKGLTDRIAVQWNGRDCQSVTPQVKNLV